MAEMALITTLQRREGPSAASHRAGHRGGALGGQVPVRLTHLNLGSSTWRAPSINRNDA